MRVDLNQFDTCRPSEFRVEAKHVDRELHLVDDTLAGSVSAAEQFKVFDSVLAANSVDVVDGFSREQISSEMLSHDVTMFHHSMFFSGDERRDGNPYVSMSLDVPFDIAALEARERASSLPFGFALLIAIFLLCVKTASRLTPAWSRCSALLASKSVAGFGGFLSACCRAGHRTIERIAAVFFAVRGQIAFSHRESVAAFPASERNRNGTFGRWLFVEAVVASADEAAKFAIFFARRVVKNLLTVQALFFDGHRMFSLLGSSGNVSMFVGIVK